MFGSARTGFGSVRTAGGDDDSGGGGGGSTPPGAIFDLKLSYGHGDPGVDDQLPDSEGAYEAWLSGTDTADLIEIGQVREWELVEDFAFCSLIVRVDLSQLNPINADATTCRFVVTLDGTDTAISVVIPNGAGADFTLSTGGALVATAGHKVGIAFATDGAMDVGSVLRCEARLVAAPSEVTVVPTAPAVGARFWFDATRGVTRTGTAVTGWADQSGHNFNAGFTGMPPGSRNLVYNPTSTNGLPGLTGTHALTPQGLIYTAGNVYVGGAPRTVFAVVRFGVAGTFGSLGGYVFTFRRSAPEFACGVFTHGPPDPPGHQLWYTDFNAPTNIEATTPVDYSGQALLLRWQTDIAGTHLTVFKGTTAVPTLTNVVGGELGNTGFIIGNLINDDGHAVFQGDLNEIIGYDGGPDASRDAQVSAYLANKWGVAA